MRRNAIKVAGAGAGTWRRGTSTALAYPKTMRQLAIWHGTQSESFELVSAITHHCGCEFGLMGARLNTCAPHRMLVDDQRALNGLLFARRMADRLRQEEWAPPAED